MPCGRRAMSTHDRSNDWIVSQERALFALRLLIAVMTCFVFSSFPRVSVDRNVVMSGGESTLEENRPELSPRSSQMVIVAASV